MRYGSPRGKGQLADTWLRYLSLPCCGTTPELHASHVRQQRLTLFPTLREVQSYYPIETGSFRLDQGNAQLEERSLESQTVLGEADRPPQLPQRAKRLTPIAAGFSAFTP